MTRTISLITAMIGAALLFAVPALGDDWAADRRSDPVGYLSPDSADRAAALAQEQLMRMLDAREAAMLRAPLLSEPESGVFQRAARAAGRESESTAGAGWEPELGQIGLGFGIGILLAVGLALAVRFTRVHRLAH
jgi:hypothetical protein